VLIWDKSELKREKSGLAWIKKSDIDEAAWKGDSDTKRRWGKSGMSWMVRITLYNCDI